MENNFLLGAISILTLTGFSFSFWFIISILRLIFENIFKLKKKHLSEFNKYTTKDIAAVIPAHNEEKTILRTITALLKILPAKQIYVASDYSTDKTVGIARSLGVRVLDIKKNKGKARALVWIMQEYGLLQAYKFIIINDADSEIDQHYVERALPYFNDPDNAAIAVHGVTREQKYSFWQNYLIAYRIRLWRIIQWGMRYGQTWKYTNVSFIVPGSLSMYRTSVLKKLEIDVPGLIIEDFNMTFELHKKKLGKIVYTPKIIGIHQDPYNLNDYIRQVQRWNVGFFQTVKRHGVWPSFFWFATTVYYIELYAYAFFIGLLPVYLAFFITNRFAPLDIPFVSTNLRFTDLLIGVFFMDYLTTAIAAFLEKKPFLLFYGFGFIFLRYIDALIYIGSPIVAWFIKSKGTWASPKRL